MSAPQTGVVVPIGSGGFSPARGRPSARACWRCHARELGELEPVRHLITSQAKLLKWFDTAWPGERFTYHVGNLAADRAAETSQLSPTDREEIDRIAQLIMAAVAHGWLMPAQRRRPDGHVDYIAIRVKAQRTGNNGEARWA